MKFREGYMLQAGKYLLSCLMIAIDRGMESQYGKKWFSAFKSAEEKENIPIITEEESLEDMDLQACLKLFKFRSEYRDAVLSYFGFYDLGTESQKKEWRNTFTQAVTRLIENYRNKYMHLRAGSAEDEWEIATGQSSYGVGEAISDMKEVSKHFLTVKDPAGVSYYDRICECETLYAKDKSKKSYIISEEIGSGYLKGYSEEDFIRACNELNIPVEKNDDGDSFYFSSDHAEDLQIIKKQMSFNREKTSGRRKKIAVISALIGAGAAVAALLFVITFAGKDNSGYVTGVSAEEYHTDRFETGDIDPDDAKRLIFSLAENAGRLSFDEYKQYYTKKYREDDSLDDYIEIEQKWLTGIKNCKKRLFVPVVKDENVLGASVIFYGSPGDPGYRHSRLFTFSKEDGELKVALEKIAAVSKYTGDHPSGYNSAAAEKRNTFVSDEADRSFKDEAAVFDGTDTVYPVLGWADKDGSVSLLIRIANGTETTAKYDAIHVNVKTGSDAAAPGIILYDGDVDLRRSGNPYSLEPGTGVNFIVNIKKDSLSEGAAVCDWQGLDVSVTKNNL